MTKPARGRFRARWSGTCYRFRKQVQASCSAGAARQVLGRRSGLGEPGIPRRETASSQVHRFPSTSRLGRSARAARTTIVHAYRAAARCRRALDPRPIVWLYPFITDGLALVAYTLGGKGDLVEATRGRESSPDGEAG